ncbi:MAG: histidine triad nucleotide-binding protein [Endomicrobiia bacterium]
MDGCIFCKIVNKEIKSEIVYEDEKFVVFKDINPQAPIHLLLVPKQHISSVNDIDEKNEKFLEGFLSIIKKIAQKLNFSESGYRVVVNTGKDSGQEVLHIHFHILAKRKFSWPPG